MELKKGNFLDSKHVYGHAFHLLREAQSFIDRNTAIASEFIVGNMAREDIPEYPFNAVREALINAICHRDYSSVGGSITITIYDDRLEIANAGTLPEGIDFNDLKQPHSSHPRNLRILNVFNRRGLIEAIGMGTQEIIESCLSSNMKEPEFFEQAGTFVVRLWSRHYSDDGAVKERNELTDKEKSIIKALGDTQLSLAEIFEQLNAEIPRRTLSRHLNTLKEKGYIDYEGPQGKNRKWYTIK